MDTPDFKSFDIADMFSGTAYPEDVVDFYTDASTAYGLYKLTDEARKAIALKDEDAARDVEARREELLRKGEKHHYLVHVRGVSRDDRENVRKVVDKEFPPEVNMFNQLKPNAEADEKYINLMWALHITRIETPDGRTLVSPSEGDVKAIRGKAPETETAKVEAKIQELREGAASGFEALVQEHDFLSSASPEA